MADVISLSPFSALSVEPMNEASLAGATTASIDFAFSALSVEPMNEAAGEKGGRIVPGPFSALSVEPMNEALLRHNVFGGTLSLSVLSLLSR